MRLWTWTWAWACKLLCCFPSLFVDLFIEPRLETLIKKCFGPEQIFKLQSSNNFMKKEIKLSSVKKKTLGARMECFRLFVENVLQMTLHDAIRRREIDDDWVLYRKIFSVSDFPMDELNISNQSFITFSSLQYL